ncbi:hypothetical protein KY284_007565 [Solanum tuberosum]|nr:hypothetical protein KY284_007565 [Solanum tuberosum]
MAKAHEISIDALNGTSGYTTWRVAGCGILNEEKRKGKEEKSEQDQGKEPVVVLQDYEEVFMEPKELPPFIWQFDHITLKERSNPINTRPDTTQQERCQLKTVKITAL